MSLNYYGDFKNFQRPPETSGVAAAFIIVLFVIGLTSGVFALSFGWISVDLLKRESATQPAAQPTQPAQQFTVLDWDIPEGHFYTQTNGLPPGTSAMGYSVTDSEGIPFWTEFQQLGGLTIVGYPLTSRFEWKGMTTQVFQRAVMQWSPEAEQVELANIMDELHYAGKDDWLLKEYLVPKSVPDDFDAGRTWEQARDNRMLFIGKSQAMKDKYAAVPDPLKMYGLPASAIEEMDDHNVIRLQRGVLRQWTEDKPGAVAGEVTVANSGEMLLNSGLLVTAKTAPEQGQPPAESVVSETSEPATEADISGMIVVGTATPQPVAEAEGQAQPGATPTPLSVQTVRVINTGGEGVYIRRTPHAADKITPWPDNTTMKVVGGTAESEGQTWLNVEDPQGNRGWIPKQYLSPVE